MKYAVERVLSPHHLLAGGYIVRGDIKLNSMPESVDYKGSKLVRKNEFHITTISIKRIAELIDNVNTEKVTSEIIEYFLKFINSNDLVNFELLNEFRYVTRDVRKTIVVLCNFPGGDKFFEALEMRFGKPIPRQPFHITIFSLEPEVGISLSSTEELAETKEISLPELKNIRQA